MGVNYDEAFRTLAKANCNATSIEFFMWDPNYDIARGLEPLKAPYKRAVAAARNQGGILFVSLLNDNQGKGTYGSKRKEWAHHATLANDALAKADKRMVVKSLFMESSLVEV
jgi:hypothetical protein